MSYALVGSAGAVSTGTSGASVTPAWGTGESRTAGNLLILVVTGNGTTGSMSATPTGWSLAKQATASAPTSGDSFASIYYKIAAGGDAAPTVTGISGYVLNAQLYEFTGNTGTPLDQVGSTLASGSENVTVTAFLPDALSGELVIAATGTKLASAATSAATDSLNNGAATNDTNNAGSSVTNHYWFAYGVTTGNSVADKNTHSGGAGSGNTCAAGVIASFKVVPGFTLNQPGALSPPAFVNENGDNDTTGYDPDGSVSLNGTSGYVSLPTNATIDAISTDPTHAWTVEAWIYPTAVRSSAGECAIVTRQYSASNIPFVLGYGFSSPADAQGAHAGTCAAPTGAQVWTGFFISGDGWYQCADPTPLAAADLNTWIHYVGTWDATGLSLYRNGVRVNTGVPTPGFTAASSSGLATYIGKRWDSSGTTPFFPGRIDEVAIYNKALSETQVTSHFAAQKVRIDPTWTDISADVMSAQTQRGRTYELDAYQAGTATVVLDDAERKYDAANNLSPYNGGDAAHPWYRILPLRPIRIRAAANDLSNPDMELALSGTDWVALTSAAISLDTGNYYTGSQSLKVITASSTGSGVRSERVPTIWQRLEANAIVNYQVTDVRTSAWIYADSGTDVRFYIQELNASNSVVATSSIQTVTGASAAWTELSLDYTLTDATTTQVQVVFDVGSAATATFHVDAVAVKPIWPIFQGYVDAWPETWEPPDYATTTLTAADGFEPLTQAQIETTVLSPVPVGTAYTQIPQLLNLAYWPGPSNNKTGMRYITYSNSTDITKEMASLDGSQGSDYALTVLQDVTNSELGSFFMGKNGAATFQDGLYRTNFITVMGYQGQFSDDESELDSGAMLEYADMTTSYDQQRIINDWTVSPDTSASPATDGRAINADSIRRYLRRSNTRSTRLHNASDAQTQASSLITRTGTDVWNGGRVTPASVLRVETLVIQPLSNRLLWRQALQREISDLIYVERTPGGQGPGAGGSGLRGTFFIEQVTWAMDVNSPWQVSWQLSPSSFSTGAHPFQLDVSPYDRLDSTHPLL